MSDPIMKYFKGIEVEKRKKINSLMRDWKKAIPDVKVKIGNKYYHAKDCFASDGFYPGYYSKKPKVLFIGREARWAKVEKDNIAQFLLDFINRDDHNQGSFTRRLFYIVEGIKSKGTLNFKEVHKKTANGIAKELRKTKDYGYAIMNISKYSNGAKDGGKANYKLINSFLEHSNLEKRNFFREELAILDPDVIITLNLWNGKIKSKYLDLCFGKMDFVGSIPDIADEDEIRISNKKRKLININHLTSHKSDKKDFYDPIMKLLFQKKKK